MQLKEIIRILDNYILDLQEQWEQLYEMAQPRAKVREKVRDLSTIIIKHILKILLYGKEEQQTLHHWSHELGIWFDNCVIKIKKVGKDRYPTVSELITWLTDYYSTESDIEYIRYSLEKDYVYQGHRTREDVSNKMLYEQYLKIIKEICPLAINKQTTDDKIQEVLTKYLL